MKSTTNLSISLIGSLLIEVDVLNSRSKNIVDKIYNCKNINLIKRLHSELLNLNRRCIEIKNSAKMILTSKLIDDLSIQLLIEICQRTIIVQNKALKINDTRYII